MEWSSIIQPLHDYVVKPVCSFTKKHISYVVCESKIIKDLGDELKKLEDVKAEIDMCVEGARGKEQTIFPRVDNWLEESGTRIEEVKQFLDPEKTISDNRSDFNQWFCSICNHYKTGKEATNMLNILKGKLDEARELRSTAVGIPPPPSPPAPMALPPTAYSNGYASRESLLDHIIEALKVKNMIGIHGMPGVGKTVLVERLAAEVKSRNLFDEVGIAVVSQTPDLAVIRNVIADRILHKDLRGSSEEGKKDDLYIKLSALMHQQKRVLLVLDDAWEALELHKVGIPCPKKIEGFKIVVTTRSRQVCVQMGDKEPFQVRVLDKKEAWSLFRQELGDSSKKLDSDEGYKDLAEEMVEHFGGLPLALVTLARALIGEALPVWRDIARYLRERCLGEIDGMSEKVIGAIEVSFNYLRHREPQFIFLLCCLFPEDWDIEIQVLMRYGIGLGLFPNLSLVQAMDRVERLIEMLKSRNLLLQGNYSKTVKMHDVTRDVGLHIASKGEFNFLVKDYCGDTIDAASHDMLIEKRAISISSKTSIMEFFLQDHKMEYRNLHILRLHGIRDSDKNDFLPLEFSACFFEGMGNLKVLEMRHMEISSFPTSLGSLKNNLRTMCLRDCMINDFTMVGELTNLEILDLQGSIIHSGFYEAVRQMIGLRVLDLTSCRVIELFDNLIGRLSRLEVLYMLGMENMDVGKPIITSPVELETLTRLKVLEVQVGIPEQLTNNFFAILGKLSSFHIWVSEEVAKYWDRFGGKDVTFTTVTMNEHLQQRLGRLLRVANSFVLRACNGLPMMFRYGDDVSNLRYLNLRSCNDVEFVIRGPTTKTQLRHDQLTSFTKLEVLSLERLLGLKEICAPQQYVCLSKLNRLGISKCERLPYAFTNSVAKQLRQLESISIMDCWGMEEIFSLDNDTSGLEMDDSIVLPSLQYLRLYNLKKLKVFSAKNRSHGGQPAFFGVQVQLPMLEILYMNYLPSCEKIWEIHHPKGSFGKLRELSIFNYKRLRYIFPVDVARGLVQIERLTIRRCYKLEEVVEVGNRNGAEEEEESKIIFPRLKRIELRNLHSLHSFCSARCSTLEFPSLEDVTIEGNMNMEIFTYGSLYTPKRTGQDSLNTIVVRQYEETKRSKSSGNSESFDFKLYFEKSSRNNFVLDH